MPTAPIITSSENSILKSLLFEITRFISHIPKNKKVRLFKPDLKRRHPDLNWGSGCCRPTPYHLAIAPYLTTAICFISLLYASHEEIIHKTVFKF